MDNKDQLIQDLINYYLVERTRPAFDKFKQGLDSVGVYEYIWTYPKQFRELFSRQEPLTAEKMSAIFTICYSYASSDVDEKASDDGESREDNDHDMMTKVEQRTTEFWKTYLSIVEAGGSPINLENILMFATGMKEQPYGQYPKIYFNHSYFGEPASKYPTSSTCSCVLYLPLHDTFEEFKEAMDFGILNGDQFGNA
ncbi:hypothetical protein CHS0354_012151 [Potamilus streckersoni]|uniref:HECT domain-containing protein n=1 Tax=Potamilus streckersoni TaxID=2493646 RepID=A0AAE0S9Y2_9BIVA|nr:hypothetical protein CHS0354_012151 [Potamilus streckersoni]